MQPFVLWVVARFFNPEITGGHIDGQGVGDGLEQMRLNQFTTELCKGLEGRAGIHKRNARKIDFQEVQICFPVGRAVQHGVEIAQDVFGAVVVLVFSVHERSELRAEVFNSPFALERVGIFKESVVTVFPALRWWVEVEGEEVIDLFQ